MLCAGSVFRRKATVMFGMLCIGNVRQSLVSRGLRISYHSSAMGNVRQSPGNAEIAACRLSIDSNVLGNATSCGVEFW